MWHSLVSHLLLLIDTSATRAGRNQSGHDKRTEADDGYKEDVNGGGSFADEIMKS